MDRKDVMNLILTSSAFASGGIIPPRYTCDGEDVSPPLTWRNVPEGTKSLTLIFDDPDAPNGPRSHWVLYNIPAGMTHLRENVPPEPILPWGGMQGRNDSGEIGYEGPCPPAGSMHGYYFRLYALDQQLALTPGAVRAQVLDAIQDHILLATELLGRYTHP